MTRSAVALVVPNVAPEGPGKRKPAPVSALASLHTDQVGSMFGAASSLSFHADGLGFTFRTGPGPRRVR